MIQEYKFKAKNGFGSLPTVEVENKETILLPTGETYKITGKSHKSGGEKIWIPDSTRVYSHHLKVDKDLVEEITGKKLKGRQSYADLSKKYDTSQYIDKLENDKTLDALGRKTNILNLRNMLAKQEEIFHAQESSKDKKKKKSIPKFQHGGDYEQFRGLYQNPMTQTLYDDDYLYTMNLPNRQSLERSLGRKQGDIFENNGLKYQTIYSDANRPYFNDGTYKTSALYNGQSTPLGNNLSLFNQENYLQNQRRGNIQRQFGDNAANKLDLLEQEYLKRTSLDRIPTAGRNVGRNYLDNPGRGYNEDNQDQIFNIGRRVYDNVNPLPPIQRNDLTGENTNINIPTKTKVHVSPKETYDNYTPYNETPIGIDPEKLVNGVQQGLLLSQLATLESENPYYTGTTLKAPITRFDPINTRQAERLYNLGKETLSKSNLPESAKQARLGQLQAQLAEQSSNVALTNSQNRTNLRNQNNQTAINVYNTNAQNTTQANYTYMRERARGNELRELQRQHFLDNALNHWRSSLENKQNIGLLNQTSRNFNFDSRNGVQYQPGQGYDIDPILRGFNQK